MFDPMRFDARLLCSHKHSPFLPVCAPWSQTPKQVWVGLWRPLALPSTQRPLALPKRLQLSGRWRSQALVPLGLILRAKIVLRTVVEPLESFFRGKKYAVEDGVQANARKALGAAYAEKDAWEQDEWDAHAALILQPFRTKIVHGGKRDSNMPGVTPPQGSADAIVPREAVAQSSAAAIAPGEAFAQAKRPLVAGDGALPKKKKPRVTAAAPSIGTPAGVVAHGTLRRWRKLLPVSATPMDMLRDAIRLIPPLRQSGTERTVK